MEVHRQAAEKTEASAGGGRGLHSPISQLNLSEPFLTQQDALNTP